MTVREIIEGIDSDVKAHRAQILKLEDRRERIMRCVKETPSPAVDEETEGVIKLCDARKKAPTRRAA